MASNPVVPEHLEPLPGVRCRAGSAPRASHEWAPLRVGGYYCTACLSRLRPVDVEDWRLLLEIETQRGDSVLGGDAYATLSEMVANTILLSPGERRLLQRLGAEPAYVVRHGDLAAAMWGPESADDHDRAALRQQVTTLRRKLAKLQVGVGAVPGIGYRIVMSCRTTDRDDGPP